MKIHFLENNQVLCNKNLSNIYNWNTTHSYGDVTCERCLSIATNRQLKQQAQPLKRLDIFSGREREALGKNNTNTRFKRRPVHIATYNFDAIKSNDELDFYLNYQKQIDKVNKEYDKTRKQIDKKLVTKCKQIHQNYDRLWRNSHISI
jgi:arginyl-tRNA--protein-N-Asp/Glu arginylyltransferase